ncbi:MAG: dethiobiotin synthase [Sphingobacteriaceae bacterium]|nr:dethiobiotin synthase [Sphingobacteriaceae bacterium]
MNKYFITGIGTGVGKTVVAAAFTEALKADYWKPVQCGLEGGSDSSRVKQFVKNQVSVFHPETFVFNEPASPHLAALLEAKKLSSDQFILPNTQNSLIIEGAGGLLVPLNEHNYVIDLAADFDAEVVLVCGDYLGCINHSLLSIDFLLKNDFNLTTLVLNGNFHPEVKKAIINYAEIPKLIELPKVEQINEEVIGNFAGLIKKQFN